MHFIGVQKHCKSTVATCRPWVRMCRCEQEQGMHHTLGPKLSYSNMQHSRAKAPCNAQAIGGAVNESKARISELIHSSYKLSYVSSDTATCIMRMIPSYNLSHTSSQTHLDDTQAIGGAVNESKARISELKALIEQRRIQQAVAAGDLTGVLVNVA